MSRISGSGYGALCRASQPGGPMTCCDPLESRVLMSISFRDGLLKIGGTKKIDIIGVSFINAPQFNVREVVVAISGPASAFQKFPFKKVKRVEIRSGADSDIVTVVGARK